MPPETPPACTGRVRFFGLGHVDARESPTGDGVTTFPARCETSRWGRLPARSNTTRTEHPHVVRVLGVAGGIPTMVGTRISVAFVVGQLRAGDTPADILASYPHLSPAAVYDAISYCYHEEEIDRFIAACSLEAHARQHSFAVDDDRLRFDER